MRKLRHITKREDTNHRGSESTMILGRAFVLLFATLSGAKGFTVSPSSAVTHQVSRPLVAGLRVATTSLQSEVEEASEETTTAEPSGFDKTIYIGNVSFGAS